MSPAPQRPEGLESQHRDAASLGALCAALGDPDPRVRERAARALGAQGPSARAAWNALLRALHDDAGAVRVAAASAIHRLVPPADA